MGNILTALGLGNSNWCPLRWPSEPLSWHMPWIWAVSLRHIRTLVVPFNLTLPKVLHQLRYRRKSAPIATNPWKIEQTPISLGSFSLVRRKWFACDPHLWIDSLWGSESTTPPYKISKFRNWEDRLMWSHRLQVTFRWFHKLPEPWKYADFDIEGKMLGIDGALEG